MDTVIGNLGGITFTGWKICGLVGTVCFGLRWFVQAWHRKRTGSAVIPLAFWLMSVVGTSLTLLYFIFGKNDSVGIIGNALPLSVALYNVWLDLAHRRTRPSTA